MDELLALEPDPDKRDDLIRGIEWILQRNPKYGACIITSDPPVWMVPVADVMDKAYMILYTFNEKKVFFLSIRPADGNFMEPADL